MLALELELALEIELALDIECYHITTSVSHQSEQALMLEIELALVLDIEHYCITTSVSHLTCSLPPHHQSEPALALELELALEIELALDIECYHITTSAIRLAPCHHISQSSVRASASARDRASTSARHRALLYHCISQSFDLPTATTSVRHLTCSLPLYHCNTALPHKSVI